MTVETTTRVDVVPLTKHIGAEIRGVDLSRDLDRDVIAQVRQAWLDHGVVLFRGQKLSQDDQHQLLSMDPYTFTVDQWAEQGWTKILLKGITRTDFADQLERAWRLVAPKSALKALEAKRG